MTRRLKVTTLTLVLGLGALVLGACLSVPTGSPYDCPPELSLTDCAKLGAQVQAIREDAARAEQQAARVEAANLTATPQARIDQLTATAHAQARSDMATATARGDLATATAQARSDAATATAGASTATVQARSEAGTATVQALILGGTATAQANTQQIEAAVARSEITLEGIRKGAEIIGLTLGGLYLFYRLVKGVPGGAASLLALARARAGVIRDAYGQPIILDGDTGIVTQPGLSIVPVLDMRRAQGAADIPLDFYFEHARRALVTAIYQAQAERMRPANVGAGVAQLGGAGVVGAGMDLSNLERNLPAHVALPARTAGARLPLGVGESGPVEIDRADFDGGLVTGGKGAGKSNFLRLVAILESRAGSRLYLADPQNHTFYNRVWNRVEGVAYRVATELPDFLDLLQAITAECARRAALFAEQHTGNGDLPAQDLGEFNRAYPDRALPFLALLGDEMNTWLSDDAARAALLDVVRRNRKYGLAPVILAAHSFSARQVDTDLSSLFQTRIAFAGTRRTAYYVLQDPDAAAQAAGIHTRGRAVMHAGAWRGELQTYAVSKSDIFTRLRAEDAPAIPTPEDARDPDRVVLTGEIIDAPGARALTTQELAEQLAPHWAAGVYNLSELARRAGYPVLAGAAYRKVKAAVTLLESGAWQKIDPAR